jgi:hypothetical protein
MDEEKMMKIESPAKGSPALLRKQIQSTGRQASHPHREAEKMNIQFRVVSCEITLFCSLLERFDDDTVVQHAPKLGKPCLSSLLARRRRAVEFRRARAVGSRGRRRRAREFGRRRRVCLGLWRGPRWRSRTPLGRGRRGRGRGRQVPTATERRASRAVLGGRQAKGWRGRAEIGGRWAVSRRSGGVRWRGPSRRRWRVGRRRDHELRARWRSWRHTRRSEARAADTRGRGRISSRRWRPAWRGHASIEWAGRRIDVARTAGTGGGTESTEAIGRLVLGEASR